MKKKSLYIAGGIVVLVLGYLNYYSNEAPTKSGEKTIESRDVSYVGDGFTINAEKQLDNVSKNESTFSKAQALIKNLVISGDNAFLDAAKNLVLKSNIIGKSANGWSFNAESIKYDRDSDSIYSDERVTAKNESVGVEVSGDTFKSDSKMSFVELRKNIVFENEKIKVTGDAADYSDTQKTAILRENVKLEGKNLGEKYKGTLTGEFGSLKYNFETKKLESDTPFKIYYGAAVISADRFQYDQENDYLFVDGNLTIETGGYTIHAENVEKKSDSQDILINGKITGNNEVYSFEADNGKYSPETEELELVGNLKLNSKNSETLTADKVVYNINSEVVTLSGIENNVKYASPSGELSGKSIVYDMKNRNVKSQGVVQFKNSNYSGTGEELFYDFLIGKGEIKNGEILNGTRKLSAPSILYTQEGENFTIPDLFTVTDLKSSDKLVGKTATYSQKTGIFSTENGFELTRNSNVVTGTGVVYNELTGLGSIKENIQLNNVEKNINITGDTGEFIKDNYFVLKNNVKMKFGKYHTETTEVKYKLEDETVAVPGEMTIVSDEDQSSVHITDPLVDTRKGTLYGTKFSASNEKYEAVSDKVEYDYNNEIIRLLENGKVTDKSGTVTGNDLEYQSQEQIIDAKGEYTLQYNGITTKGNNIHLNRTSGEIKGGKIHFLTDKNQEFQADTVSGNLNELYVDFIGNAKGKNIENGKVTEYSGEKVKVHLKNENSSYKATRVELLKDSRIFQDDFTLYSKYSDINLESQTAKSTGGVRIVMEDTNKGTTEMTTEQAVLNMKTEVVKMDSKIRVVNNNPEKGSTIITGDKGTVDKKASTAELIGNVVVDSPDAIVHADRAIYNDRTRKVNAYGDNIVVDYKVKKP